MNKQDTPLTSEQSELAARHVGIAYLVAAKRAYAIGLLGYEDVLSASLLGLCHAARAFDPELGVAFGTFADKCIRSAVSHETRTFLRQRNYPRHLDGSLGTFCSIDDPGWNDRTARLDLGPMEVDALDFVSKQRSRERRVVALRMTGLNNAQIGRKLGFSKQYVCQLTYETLARIP